MKKPKKFRKGLSDAWSNYQLLYDRYMGLLRLIGMASGIEELREVFEEDIDYAMEEWATPDERFDAGDYDGLGLDIDGEDK